MRALTVITTLLLIHTLLVAGQVPVVSAELIVLEHKRFEPPQFALALTNNGPETLRLVAPGDGSCAGARTPRVEIIWSQQGQVVPPKPVMGCGNVNPPKASDVIALSPGKTVQFTAWLYPYPPAQSGTYQVQIRYTNDPTKVIAEFAKSNDPSIVAAQKAIAFTSPLQVSSNQITVHYEANPLDTLAALLAGGKASLKPPIVADFPKLEAKLRSKDWTDAMWVLALQNTRSLETYVHSDTDPDFRLEEWRALNVCDLFCFYRLKIRGGSQTPEAFIALKPYERNFVIQKMLKTDFGIRSKPR